MTPIRGGATPKLYVVRGTKGETAPTQMFCLNCFSCQRHY